MKNLLPQVMVLGLCVPLLSACGETVNYDTQEKPASANALPSEGNSIPSGASGETTDPAAEAGTSNGSGDASQPLECQSGNMLTKQEMLVFPEITAAATCAFGQGDNLSKVDGYFRAYLRQTQVVTLPVGAILCGFSLTHQSQAMRYDDEMFFSVNDKLLLATKDYSEYFPKVGLFETFSWAGLKNKVYDSTGGKGVYCVGGAEGLSTCSVPPTETQGNIALSFSPELNRSLSKALQNNNVLTFEWITTGDNDNSDCRHTEIDMNLGLSYVMPR